MNDKNNLKILPINFRHEKDFLTKNNFDSWEKIRNLSDSELYNITRLNLLCTKSRLVKIRAIATFIIDLNLLPHEAYLLLHSGIANTKALSNLNPDILKKKIGRLERNLNLKTKINIDMSLIKIWISRAKKLYE